MNPPPSPAVGIPPLVFKGFALALVGLALAAALAAVGGIVDERQARLREAEASVAASLASAQTVLGPMLQRDCFETWEIEVGEGKDRKTVSERREWKLAAAPGRLDVKARVAIEPRYRGIFKVNGYVMQATLDATWPDARALVPQPPRAGVRQACSAPQLLVALGDSRGVRKALVQIDGVAAAVLPGTAHAAHGRGFHVDLAAERAGTAPLSAKVELDLVGTGELAFAPIGETTSVSLASDWPHPSFTGRFLPIERTIDDTGFAATWRLSALATSAPQEVIDGASFCAAGDVPGELAVTKPAVSRCVETFGVSFIDPVSTYTLSDRATKYGLLFIGLTFAGVGAIEVLKRLRVHPVQYGLVGAALVIFFLLLVSLGEHLPFAIAYLVASAACTALLAFYGRSVLGGTRAGLGFGAAVATLYGLLFLLLQLEQKALLLGSVLLFVTLAALMVATRRIDWYALGARGPDGAPAPSGP